MMHRVLLALCVMGCAGKKGAFDPEIDAKVDVVIVPGCPSSSEGEVSSCQWQRAIWAHKIWEDEATRSFITSGGAVHNRYIEAEGIKAAMIELGVPGDRIFTETQALHSDENASYGVAMADALGLERIGVASHGGHANSIRQMIEGWTDIDVYAFRMPLGQIIPELQRGTPSVRTEPVPADEWLKRNKRERILAKRLDKAKRPHSLIAYTWLAISGTFGTAKRPMPPVTEPTLCGKRHRIDTAPWPTDVCQVEPAEFQ